MSARHSKMHAALNKLRKQTAVPGRQNPKRAQQIIPPPPQTPEEPRFAELLRTEPGTIRTLRQDHRVEIEQVKPEPVKKHYHAQWLSNDTPGQYSTPDFDTEGMTPLRKSFGDRTDAVGRKPTQLNTYSPHADDWGNLTLPSPRSGTEHLSDAELFRLAMHQVESIDARNRAELDIYRPKPAPIPRQTRDDEQAALQEAIEGPISLSDHLEIGDETVFLRHGVPRKVLPELRRGRWAIQAFVDLHGMTRDQARSALIAFLNTCLQRGHRCVRIIHGKGLGSPDGFSVLKQLSPRWLVQREEILAFCQAAPHHGGAGALIVLLRGSATHLQRRS